MGMESGLGSPAAEDEADVVLFNARIYTADEKLPFAEAIAIRKGQIAFVGSNRQLLQAFPFARRMDAGHLTIIPGFVDAHAHLMAVGRAQLEVDLRGATSVAEVVDRVAAARERDSAWIIGNGWDQNLWPDPALPHASQLEAVDADRPVWLRRVDLHAGWANAAALRAAGIHDATADPDGGRIFRDDSGTATGILLDTAMAFMERALPPPSEQDEDRALAAAIRSLHAVGVTAVHDAGVDLVTLDRYRAAAARQALDVRIHAMVEGHGDAYADSRKRGLPVDVEGHLGVRAVKFFMDGALGSRGAALLEDYEDEPGNRGLLRYEREAFEQSVKEASQAGFQVCTHAIGDLANRIVLDAYASAMSDAERIAGRHRIEHAQIVSRNDLDRFGKNHVIASIQPAHAWSDRPWAATRLGRARISGAYAWRAIADSGALLAFGSDAPIESIDPLRGLQAAIAGIGPDPSIEADDARRLSRDAALRAYTRDAAYAGFQEQFIGSISVGKRADIVVLSDDLMRVPEEELSSMHVVATFFNGERVFGGW